MIQQCTNAGGTYSMSAPCPDPSSTIGRCRVMGPNGSAIVYFYPSFDPMTASSFCLNQNGMYCPGPLIAWVSLGLSRPAHGCVTRARCPSTPRALVRNVRACKPCEQQLEVDGRVIR